MVRNVRTGRGTRLPSGVLVHSAIGHADGWKSQVAANGLKGGGFKRCRARAAATVRGGLDECSVPAEDRSYAVIRDWNGPGE